MLVKVKKRINGKWQESMEPLETLDSYQGQDVVAQIAEGFLWVGNDKWYNKYKETHAVTTTIDLIDIVRQAQEIFMENREHRLAYMTQDGDLSDSEAHEYMNTKPHIYATQQELYAMTREGV